jgi:hypothetical protein
MLRESDDRLLCIAEQLENCCQRLLGAKGGVAEFKEGQRLRRAVSRDPKSGFLTPQSRENLHDCVGLFSQILLTYR